jgi:tetratricopeptide (TPR) repeat protein
MMKWQVAVLLCCGWISGVFALGDTEISQKVEPGGTGVLNTGSGSVTVGIPPSEYLRVAELLGMTKEKLGVTQKVLDSFLETLGEKQIPLEKLDSTLTEITKRYKDLLDKVATFTSDDPEVKRLLTEAKIALDDGKSDEAEKLYNQASDRDVAAAKQLQETAEKRLVSAAQAKFANGELKMTKLAYQEAASYYQQAAELLPAGHEEEKGVYLNNAGIGFQHAGKYNKAFLLFQKSVKIFEKIGKQHPIYLIALSNLAGLYRDRGWRNEALTLSEIVLKAREEILGKKHPDYAVSLNEVGLIYDLLEEDQKALPLYEESLKIKEDTIGKQNISYAKTLGNLATLNSNQGNYEVALAQHRESLKIFEQVLGKQHPDYATSLSSLASFYREYGELDKSIALHQEILKILEQTLGNQHFDYARELNSLAGTYNEQGEYKKALPLFKQAVRITVITSKNDHPDSQIFVENLITAQNRLNGEHQVVVERVLPDSPAAQLGIQSGDIFTHYNQQPILGRAQFIQGRAKEPADGAAKELTVLRDGKSLTFQLKPGKIGVELEEKLKSEP